MMKLLITSLAVGLALSTASTSYARDDAPIIVQSETQMEQWQKSVTRRLDRSLAVRAAQTNLGSANGIVQVRFQAGPDGKPMAMKLYRSSGDNRADRTAQWVVRRLRDLDRVPVSNAGKAMFQANIIFANSLAQKDELEGQLKQLERRRLAGNADDRNIIALGS